MALNKTFNPMRDLKAFSGNTTLDNTIKNDVEQDQSITPENQNDQQTEVPKVTDSKLSDAAAVTPKKEQKSVMLEVTDSKLNSVQKAKKDTQRAERVATSKTGESRAEGSTEEKDSAVQPQTQKLSETPVSEQTESKLELDLDLTPTADGTSISRLNKLFLKRTALKNRNNMSEIMISIISEQYNANPTFTDEELIAIEDKYIAVQKTNVKMLFTIPKYLKDFIDSKSAELGISRAVLQNHFLNEKRENSAEGS